MTYHLNRKYKCHTWKCVKCENMFNTKFKLQIHELACLNEDYRNSIPKVDDLLKIYYNIPGVIICTDKQNQIETVSPNYCESVLGKTPMDLIGTNIGHLKMNVQHLHDTIYFIHAS